MLTQHNDRDSGAVNTASPASTESRNTRRTLRQRAKRMLTAATAVGLAFGMLSANTVAANAAGGGGGAVGTGGGTVGNFSTHYMMFDNIVGSTPTQGYMQNSVQWFFDNSGAPAVSTSPNAREFMTTACNTALANAEARRNPGTPAGTSRVVGMYWASDASSVWGHGEVNRDEFLNLYNDWVSGGRTGVLTGLPNQAAYYDMINTGFQQGYNQIGPYPANPATAICIALNADEPPMKYTLSVSTDKTGVFATAGSTNTVTDTIHASNGGSSIVEKVNANVTLNWDGTQGNPKSITKAVSIANNGDTTSPAFAPSDFGWTAWPAGQFWFSVSVPQQGSMAAVATTTDRDPRETWTAAPLPPEKALTVGNPPRALGATETLASGMTYDARITASANGYSGPMAIYDTINTDKVWIGSTTADVPSTVQVLDPAGNPVGAAAVSIDRSVAGKVTVKARIPSIPDANLTGKYTLVVPTYVMPTASDYDVSDGSQVCYLDAAMGDPSKCISGNDATTHKVTPAPNKVWVLDANGALTATDPSQTNQVSADQKIFLPGDAVSAVVNGSIHAKLAQNLSKYQLIDDWTKASRFVDFSDPATAKVYYETAPGSGQFTDVTSQFTVTNGTGTGATVTTATATSAFLNQTAGQSADRAVKLVISGKFRTDYATQGQTVQLFNDGSEVWNNQAVATNEPPVFTWTPNPNKQVLGSADQSGDLAHANINGLSVYPGQRLEYSIGVDLTVPANTARGVKSLAVQDSYDPQFTPDKSSVEFWDSRNAANPQPIPRSAYTLSWDDANHTFMATFTDAWIAANVTNSGVNSAWNTKGWLSVRFTGTVKSAATPGGTVKNQAFEIINGVSTATQIPTVNVPAVAPHKEDLSTDLQNIDGKTVLKGDHLLYRLTLDGGPARDALAYNVHKLGMVDKFDFQYLDLSTAGVHVVNKATGADATAKFNVQIQDGVLYVFAKQVDSTDAYGAKIPGDPQPADLKAYDAAAIDPMESPIIDQSLLGSKYWITMDTTVKQVTDGYTIKNQGVENIENTHLVTEIVSNPLKDIDPTKDVVVSEQTQDNSINQSEVKLNGTFNYRLNSSEIPPNRAYGAKNWSLTDKFDAVHDQFTGVWAIYANDDLYNGSTLAIKKGELLQDSAGHEAEALKGLFTETFDPASYTLTVTANQNYLDLVNSRGDLPAAFSVYTQMVRIAPGDKVINQTVENYNSVDRNSNIVWTKTPENPAISVVKFTLAEGQKAGDRNTASDAYPVDQATIGKMASPGASTDPTAGVKVGFHITNTGDVLLKNVTMTDKVVDGTKGTVDQIVCQVPLTDAAKAALGSGAPTTQAVPAAQVRTELKVGQSFDCQGTLQGLTDGQLHGDNATATGESVFTGKKVQASDPWYAKAPAGTPAAGNPNPGQPVPPRGAITGIPLVDSANPWLLGGGAALLTLAAVVGTAIGIRARRNRRSFVEAESTGAETPDDKPE